MVFFSLNDNDGLVAIYGCNEELSQEDINDIQDIAVAAHEDVDDDLDELFEIIIQRSKKELDLDIFLCSPDYDIFI